MSIILADNVRHCPVIHFHRSFPVLAPPRRRCRRDRCWRTAQWLGLAVVVRSRRRVQCRSGGDEPPVVSKGSKEAPIEEPVHVEEPVLPAASAAEPVKSQKPVIQPAVGDPDPPDQKKVPAEPSSEADESIEAASDEIAFEVAETSTETPPETITENEDDISSDTTEASEDMDEEDDSEEMDQVERMMGLEAFQVLPKEPTPPPASCSERQVEHEELPICGMQEEILKQVAENRVVTIIGGTGCGKSTQVPQFLIRNAATKQEPCNVMVTQPRRLAATSLAKRTAEELGLTMGVEVGYRIRGETVPGDHLSFVTAGYLLSWLTANPQSVKSMTHLILDEAHIRSADMELLLLMMRLIMRINSHLRVLLMSATMEADFFGNYFAEFSEKPPQPLYVGGRLFPVNVLYLDDLADGRVPGGNIPQHLKKRLAKASKAAFKAETLNSLGESEEDLESQVMAKVPPAIREIVQELIPEVAEGGSTILVFIPGYADLVRMHSWLYWNLPTAGSVNMGYVPPKPEQLTEDDEEEEQEDLDEFREFQGMEGPLAEPPHATKLQNDMVESSGGIKFRLFALHSQVAQEDQELVLQTPPSNICNVVLATTIAESSLTLPEVIGVIDFCVHKTSIGDPSQMGLCKISAQWCAKSACLQREGRAGRTQPGWCIRMVPKRFFSALREYDVPEILRTPLTTLYLKAKGIADGLTEVVKNDEELAEQLCLEAATPGELLKQLLAPPMTEAIDAAVYQLAQLAVLTEESPNAKVTVLGRLALYLPLDIQLCRLVWLGCHFGCAAEAVVMAAACSTASPFSNPSRLGFQDPDDFTAQLAETAATWRFFDAGHFSEPMALLRLFLGWLRRLKLTPVNSSTPQRWFRATNMLEKDAAIDPSRMTAFVSFVADLAIRCRDLCCSERDEALACRVRADLHGLVLLLRRPDKTRQEQRTLQNDDYVPAVGAVFRAPASKLYALLAAAFSENLLVGNHTRSKDVDAMLDALEMLEPSGLASQDAVLIPQHGIKRSEEALSRLFKTITGKEPDQVAQSNRFIAVRFNEEEADRIPTGSALVSRRHDVRSMGLGPPEEPRLNAVNMAPRLCHMSAGGPRRFSVGDAEFARAVSPYELEFSVVHEARGNRRYMPGIFSEQKPLGFPCHVVSPDQPLGYESFACVASDMTLSEFGAARVDNATLLMAEQLIFALITMCPVGISLELGFGQGPGGSTLTSHAALMGLRFQRKGGNPVLFRRYLPGMVTLDKVNRIRRNIMENLVSPAETNPDGQEILLWEDEESQQDFDDLITLVNDAESIESLGGLYGAESFPVMWIRHRPNLRLVEDEKDEEDENLNDADFEDELDENADIQALQPIAVRDSVEQTVAYKTAEFSPQIQHQHECPDCGERFRDWKSCREHLILTGHLDVSTPDLELEAKKLTKPVRWRCLECFEGFMNKSQLEQHLAESGHLAWAASKRGRGGAHLQHLLCKPRAIPGLDTLAEPGLDPEDSKPAPEGFFRSLNASLWSASSSSSAMAPRRVHPDQKTEEMIVKTDLPEVSKGQLRGIPAMDARYVLRSYDKSKPDQINNPIGWVTGILRRLAESESGTSSEWDSLLLRLDALDIDFGVRIQLKQIPLQDAKRIVQNLIDQRDQIKNPAGYLTREVRNVKTPQAAARQSKKQQKPADKGESKDEAARQSNKKQKPADKGESKDEAARQSKKKQKPADKGESKDEAARQSKKKQKPADKGESKDEAARQSKKKQKAADRGESKDQQDEQAEPLVAPPLPDLPNPPDVKTAPLTGPQPGVKKSVKKKKKKTKQQKTKQIESTKG